MKTFGVVVVGFAVLALSFVLSGASIVAQDVKNGKKTEEKKDDEKKTEDKKVEKKAVRLPDMSVVNNAKKKIGKVKDVKSDDPAEITVVLVSDAEYMKFREWEVKHRSETAKDIAGTKDLKQRKEKANKFEANRAVEHEKIYSGDELTVPITETVRLRSAFLPKMYDDNNKEKKLSPAAERALKTPGVPGYHVKIENLKIGQIVEVYLKPPAPMPKAAPMPVAKKGPIGADPKEGAPAGPPKTEVYMVLIKEDPK